MNVFYEDDGGFKAGNVLSDQGASLQVESASGKRSKVKSAHVLFDFREPDAATLMRDAQRLSDGIDLEFLWQCAPEGEFSFADLAGDYYGRAATPVESAALVTRLHSAPMYFYRKGRGRYRSAPPDALKAALAGVERKRRDAALQSEFRDALVGGHLPDAVRAATRELLFRPDRNRVEYKAMVEAAAIRRTTPERLMLDVGAVASPAALHRDRFVFAHFPRGTGFPSIEVADVDGWPLVAVEAFSIDDSETTEIDDALSVAAIDPPGNATAAWRIGIHIAAPGLAIRRGDPIDAIARERASTVYAPGEKITMLPDAVVERFTLAAGRDCLAVSLYLDAVESAGTWRVVASASRIERVPIVDNLRHDALDASVTEEHLDDGTGDFPRRRELGILWRFARALRQERQAARVAAGLRPEGTQRADHAFRVSVDASGVERIAIEERRRGAPLDTVVAELMIAANATWGKLLADRGVAGIYRAQSAAFGPAGRVRMITHPAPHTGLGVAQYAWSTSPLRRYVDLVNQRQICACIDGGPPADFGAKDADLFAVVSSFEAAYAAYAEHQARMERYWCLRWLAQEGRTIVEARATRDDSAMLVEIPLLLRVPGMAVGGEAAINPTAVARGQRVELEILATDLVDLSVSCRLAAIIEEVDALDPDDEAEPASDLAPDAAEAEEERAETPVAAPAAEHEVQSA